MTDSQKNVVLITGASSGIGLELAHCFARDQHDLFLVARDESRLREVQNELQKEWSIKVEIAAGDLTDKNFLYALPELVRNTGVRVKCLVNNAGSGFKGEFSKGNWEKEEASILLNILAPTYLTKMFLQDLEATRGSIINIASMAAFVPVRTMAVYGGTKAYLAGFSESLACALRDKNVRVLAVYPGPTRSGFQKANAMGELSRFRYPSAEKVARATYRAWKNGQTFFIPGFFNKAVYLVTKFFPRSFVRWYASRR